MKKLLTGCTLAIVIAIASLATHLSSASADVIFFSLEGKAGSGLLPGNENPAAESEATGGVISGISYDTDTNVLTMDVGWGTGNGFTNLSGNATAMHIHGSADFNTNAGVKYNLGALAGYNNNAANGGFNGTVNIAGADEADLLAGLFYINVHTAENGAGELRANLVQAIPEPASASLIGLLGLALVIRRRKK